LGCDQFDLRRRGRGPRRGFLEPRPRRLDRAAASREFFRTDGARVGKALGKFELPGDIIEQGRRGIVPDFVARIHFIFSFLRFVFTLP